MGDSDFQWVKGEGGHLPSRPRTAPCRIMSVGMFNCVFLDSVFAHLASIHFITGPIIFTTFFFFIFDALAFGCLTD